MGKKKMARKQTAEKPPSTRRDETPEFQPPTEERPPNPQPQEPIPQAPVMVSLNALAAFLRQQDPNKDWAAALAGFSQVRGEGEGKASEEQKSREEEDESERTPVAEPVPKKWKGIDLNETSRKQGLMTDEEFEALFNEVTRMEDGTAKMAEGLDLASEAAGEGEETRTRNDPEGLAHQPVDEVEERQTREEEPEPVAPPVSKPKAGKRKLVLNSDPKAERPQPKRVSQRCLGKWTSSKAKANTAADAVEVSSEEEMTTPTKLGEESLSEESLLATNLEDASTATEVVTPTPSDQREETDKMAEGLDLASESVGHDEPRDDSIHIHVETQPTAQDKPSTETEKRPDQ
ncbi:uncharacterized protein LOC121781436 [Salvia splendens]|uniref:uncharacterized protein LOC121781436 n=1 Tax=Salvia splendens TaxID=180675 RepID=UPI001C25ECCF|nr:uncharacterized protein LOC121781436 [Salvia splendens]